MSRQFGDFILPFLPVNKRTGYFFLIFFTISIQACAVILLFFDISLQKTLLIAIGIPILFFFLYSVENFFVFIILYLSLTPLQSYTDMYSGFLPFGVRRKYLYVMYLLFLLYWIFSLILKKKKIKISALGWSIIAYTCLTFFAIFLGFINDNEHLLSLTENEFVPQLMYLSFFVFLTTKMREKNLRILFDFILACSAFIGLQFLYAFPQNSITAFTRIPTINVHIALLSYPYVIGILFLSESKKRKIVSLIALIPISFAVMISLQRALWGALAIILVLSIFLYLYKKGYSIGRIFLFSIVVFLSIIIIFSITVFAIVRVSSSSAVLVIVKRLASFTNIDYLKVDLSAFQRTFEIKQALSKLTGIQWLIGRGFGDTFYSKVRFRIQHYVDNSYAWVLWKMGAIGFVVFLSMFVIFFKRTIFLLRKNVTKEELIYITTIFLNMIGLLIVALTNACLVNYRFIVLWAISMAIIELMYRKYANENNTHLFKKSSRS